MAPTVRSFSADFDPLRLIERFPGDYPGLLESSAPLPPTAPGATAGRGPFDILPISCGEQLILDAGQRLSGAFAGNAGFLSALEHWWRALQIPAARSTLPFVGGWLLYLGYELAGEIEPRLQLPPSPEAVIAVAVRTPAAWVRDRATGQAWLVAEPEYESLLDVFERRAAGLSMAGRDADGGAAIAGGAGGFAEGAGAVGGAGLGLLQISEDEPEQFLHAVSGALGFIAAGDVYQANLSRQWRVRSTTALDPLAIYRRLRVTNPSPFSAVLRFGDFSVMSSSPERLLSVRGGVLSTRPIAGTRPRGKDADADAALIHSLLSDEKERAEHVMLIDLERNDVGRVCVGGTVHVDEFMVVESYAHVHHIVSNVSGVMRADASPIDAIRALFPGGTITGCPKVRCMEIIAELEGVGRGAYTGSVGYLNRDGSCDLNILIRTLSADATRLIFRAGAGIVADSRPAQELAETRAKAKGLLRALEAV